MMNKTSPSADFDPDFVYETNTTVEDLAERLKSSGPVLILTHAKPDGDALGTSLALHRGLGQLGVSSTVLLAGPIDANLLTLVGEGDRVHRLEEEGLPDEEPGLVAVVDTGAWTQVEPFAEWLRIRHGKVVGIDHHAGGDEVASERVVDVTCAAATQVLVPILDAMGVDIAADGIADPLFAGMATDTGWFRFSSAGPAVSRLAARLLEAGADKDALYARIEQNSSLRRVAMQGRALSSLELLHDGQIALMRLGPEDFVDTGARPENLAGIVNMPMEIGSVRASMLLVEFEAGATKISFRSKPALDDQLMVDVNQLAGRFGGGGHVHAAGARLEKPSAEAGEDLQREIDAFLAE